MTIDTMKKRRHAYIISHTNKFTLTLSFGVLTLRHCDNKAYFHTNRIFYPDVTNLNDYQKWPLDVDVKSK